MIGPADIADAIAQGLARREAGLRLEQAVHGMDILPELAHHPLLAESLREAGLCAFREERYPHERGKRARSHGIRCDLVATDGRALRAEESAATLFDPPDAAELAEAMWLEVKVVPQHLGPGPNPRYAAELLGPLRADVRKLFDAVELRRRALVLLLYTESRAVAEHDLAAWERQAHDRGLPVGPPCVRHVEILDRVGNRLCTVAVYPVG